MKMEPAFDAVHAVHHWVKITVLNPDNRRLIIFQFWADLTWEVRCKWAWYFRYRAARYQVQFPRAEVNLSWGNTPKANYQEIDHLNKVRAKKAKVTEVSNKIAKAVAGWNQIFPIEQDAIYQQACAKLDRLKAELFALTNSPSHP